MLYRWVYLEGIFTGSADIPHLLPVETQRFNSISSEFVQLMRKVFYYCLFYTILKFAKIIDYKNSYEFIF